MYTNHNKSTFSFLSMPPYLFRDLSPTAVPNTSKEQTPMKSKHTSHKDLTDVSLSLYMSCNEIHLAAGAHPEVRLTPTCYQSIHDLMEKI